jgi:hypothetical protein
MDFDMGYAVSVVVGALGGTALAWVGAFLVYLALRDKL